MFSVHSIETFVVNDEYRVGGTYDRIYIINEDTAVPEALGARLMGRHDTDELAANGLRVSDDGRSLYVAAGTPVVEMSRPASRLDLGAGSFAIQLGTYANSVAYNHESGSRHSAP